MIDETLEQQYVVSKLRRDLPELLEQWASRSADFRAGADARFDLSYAEGERRYLDVFYCGQGDAPVLIYIHGGYWQRGDKSMYSFIARPFVENGVNVAVLGYPICPQVSLSALVDAVRQALVYLFNQAEALGINRERFNICGSSAGGHLVAMMLATKWSDYAPDLPDDLIKLAVPVSGLYDLQPIRSTSLNDAVKMDEDEARRNSPQGMKPACEAPILITVGGAETSAFFTQMDGLMQSWQSSSGVIEQHIEDEADHFDMIERIGDAESLLFGEIIQRIQRV